MLFSTLIFTYLFFNPLAFLFFTMNRVEVKDKLRKIISEMLLSDLESNQEIPQEVADHILEKYGWTTPRKLYLESDLQNFVKRLQKWIGNFSAQKDEKIEELCYDFNAEFEKYLQIEREYFKVMSELTNLFEDIINEKDSYSEYFKEKCKTLENLMEVLRGKCQFLKLQFLIKLYGEDNALCGHLALRNKLKEELVVLKRNYSEIVEFNEQFDKIKTDKYFCELFQMYKELRKIEKRTEIIGQM